MQAHLSPDELRKQALKGQLKGTVGLLLLLMLPAWSLNFWQGWLYWLLFTVSTTAISLYLLKHDPALVESRLKAGATAERRRSQKTIQAIASVTGCAMFLVPGVERHFTGLPMPVMVVVAGNALMLAGLWIVFLAFRENSHASSIIEVKSDQKVISTGPYAVVRHPMYSGCVLAFLATPFALGSLWTLPFAIALSVVIAIRLLDEEQYLKANLDGYVAYCRKVLYRLMPRVW